MVQLRQYLALELETGVHGNRQSAAVHDLDRHLLFELSIRALGQVNLAHSAGTQGSQHPVGSNSISHHFCSMHLDASSLQTDRSCGRVLIACMKAQPPTLTRRWIMSNGNEQKNPPPPPPPPGGPKPGSGGAKPADGNQNPPQKMLRAAGVGGALGGAIGGIIGALIGCCLCLHHLH
jgi:hypothetical protein